MKLPKHELTIVILLIILSSTKCGVIDNIFGRVTNTTNALRQDARNVWSFSKSVVGIETPVDNRPEEEKRGFIGGIVHSTREKVHGIRNYFWNTDSNANDAGLFGNMYIRVKNSLSKGKVSILGDNQTPRPPSEIEKLIQKTLDKLFFGNGTRRFHGKAFQEAVADLKRKLQEIRSNIKGKESSVHHGEGLIDVRAAAINIEDNINNNTPGIDNDVYDAVQDDFNKARDETLNSYKKLKNDTEKAAKSLAYGFNNAADELNVIREKTFDATAKENELLQNSYSRANAGIQEEESIENLVEGAKKGDRKKLIKLFNYLV